MKTINKTGIITTDTYLNHNTGQGHPERADRVTVIIDHLKNFKSQNLIWEKPKKFDHRYLQLAHDKNYLNDVKESFPLQGLNFCVGSNSITCSTPRMSLGALTFSIIILLKANSTVANSDRCSCVRRSPNLCCQYLTYQGV